MSESHILDDRRRIMGLDENTIHNVRAVKPIVMKHMPEIIAGLYKHLLSLPECEERLAASNIASLKRRQIDHWDRMFDCRFDETYVAHAMRIGRVHFERKIPPYMFLAAYSYVQALILAKIAEKAKGREELAAILASISRIITLDIDLALSAYTRALWTVEPSSDAGAIFI